MSDNNESTEEQQKLPSMGAAAKADGQGEVKPASSMTRPELQKENTKLRQELAGADERAAGQNMRDQELADREKELELREQQLTAMEQRSHEALPPRVSTDENVLKENAQGAIDSRSLRDPLEMGKKFPDITPYLQKYGQENKLMWINDVDGDVQRWLDIGAEPVPWLTSRNRTFEGITDQHETKWVRVVGGETRSGTFHVYLLMIVHAEYDRIKLAPVKARQELIQRSMQMGLNQSDEKENANVQAYAPNLPSGARGLEQLREVAGEIPGL